MSRKLVVFDVDGTLVDTMGLFEKAIAEYSVENGLPLPCFESVRAGYHYPDQYDFKWGLALHEQPEHLWAAASRAVRGEAAGDPAFVPRLFDDVRKTIRRLREDGHRLAVITSKESSAVISTFTRYGLIDSFCAMRTRDDIAGRGEAEKPAPDQLYSVMRELGAEAAHTVMIGDTTMDVHMGLAAGTHTVGVTWGAHRREMLEQAGAHKILDTGFLDLAKILERL